MDEFTRKFNTSEDREVQTHYILSAVYDALKDADLQAGPG